MTPSGLSKILNGGRLPVSKEKKAFIKLAADYFAENIYSLGCYIKFRDLFPVLYDFHSLEELRSFLNYAIEYALDKDVAAANQVNLEFVERGFYFLGRKPALNLLCVMLSEHIMNDQDDSLEIYSSFSLMDPTFSALFQKIRIANPEKCKQITLNHFFDGTLQEAKGGGKGITLSLIGQLQNKFELNLWTSGSDLGQPFLFIKGALLLMFNPQIDGTPLLIPISHKSYLSYFYESLMMKDIRKISYNRNEAAALLEANPQFVPELLTRGIDSVYNFVSIGYLLDKEEISSISDHEQIAEWVWQVFDSILSGKTIFHVSIAAMERFSTFGKAIVPLIGAFPLPREQRVSYLQRFNAYLKNEQSYNKVKILDSQLSNIAALCSGDLCLVYSIDDGFERDRIHVFDAKTVLPVLERMTLSGPTLPLDFSLDLWSAYQGDLLSNS